MNLVGFDKFDMDETMDEIFIKKIALNILKSFFL